MVATVTCTTPTEIDAPMDSGEEEESPSSIAECVQKHWNQHRRPMLLSALGTSVDQQTMREVKNHARNLATYIRTRLSGSVSVVQHSTNPTIIGAVPSSEAHFTQDWDYLLARPDRDIDTPGKRFNRAFWTAFRKPLPDTSTRYLSSDDPIRFADVPPGSAPPRSLEIPRAYIPGDEATDSDVAERIAEWLRDNDLDETRYLYLPRPPQHRSERPLPTEDLLGRLITALDADELDKVTMPIALVAKLRRTPV
ncbi:MAG: hypothetical protein OXU77_20195 [Gammaproteobacteria bacterium]|nr:hypothetical protein [Gammaproteobacteria bacterium]MDE0433149.1 hypothetical protein [Bryobacterales bacterium]